MKQITDAEYRALAEFRYRLRRFLHVSEGFARDAGLEPQQHQLLLAVKGLPEGREPTIGELADRLQLQHHSAAELVDRAEERGLVQRVRAEADRRKVFVLLTPEGAEQLRSLSVHHRDELRTEGAQLVLALTTLMETAPAALPIAEATARR
ncbi:MAG: MarR family transcriptional regulator [Dehalococcoidia bacterium]|nr:MAG: MarR family transcriptional regulator [Dehalococcoidia bacterium]